MSRKTDHVAAIEAAFWTGTYSEARVRAVLRKLVREAVLHARRGCYDGIFIATAEDIACELVPAPKRGRK